MVDENMKYYDYRKSDHYINTVYRKEFDIAKLSAFYIELKDVLDKFHFEVNEGISFFDEHLPIENIDEINRTYDKLRTLMDVYLEGEIKWMMDVFNIFKRGGRKLSRWDIREPN